MRTCREVSCTGDSIPVGCLAPWDSHGSRRCEKTIDFLQKCFLSAATANAFTTVLAGFALTTIIFPKTSRFPALVAGFKRVFTRQQPGMVKTPAFFNSTVATSERASMTFVAWDFFSSHLVARLSARAPFVIAFADFIGAIPC